MSWQWHKSGGKALNTINIASLWNILSLTLMYTGIGHEIKWLTADVLKKNFNICYTNGRKFSEKIICT